MSADTSLVAGPDGLALTGELPELASVYWRRRVDARALRRADRLWTLSTVAHELPFLATAAVLPLLNPVTIPVAVMALAHAWFIPELHAARGAGVMRSPRRARGSAAPAPGAETRALGLLGDLVGHEARGSAERAPAWCSSAAHWEPGSSGRPARSSSGPAVDGCSATACAPPATSCRWPTGSPTCCSRCAPTRAGLPRSPISPSRAPPGAFVGGCPSRRVRGSPPRGPSRPGGTGARGRARRSQAAPWPPSRCQTAAGGRTRCRAGSPGRSRRRRSSAASVSAMSMPEETPAAVISLPWTTTRSDTGSAPNLRSVSSSSQCVVASQPVQQPRRGEQQRAGAHRRRPRRGRVRRAQPRQHRLVGHQRAGAEAAGHDDHLGIGDLVERGVGGQRQHAVLGALGPGDTGHEHDLGVRQPREDLVGTDRVKRGDPLEDRDRDPHSGTPPAAQPESAQHQQRLLARAFPGPAARRAAWLPRRRRRTPARAAADRAGARSRRRSARRRSGWWPAAPRAARGACPAPCRAPPGTVPSVSRSPVRSIRASGKPAHSRAA